MLVLSTSCTGTVAKDAVLELIQAFAYEVCIQGRKF